MTRKNNNKGANKAQKVIVRPQVVVPRPIKPKPSKPYTPFGDVGSKIGGMFGTTGGVLGRNLGSLIGRLFGSGDYNVSSFPITSNTLMGNSKEVPGFVTQPGTGCTRVVHREYISDVISSSTAKAFSIASYSLNPGQVSTFPWLASIAAQYEQYRIKGMVFEFKSMSSDALNSTNTALGSVILATQYNASSPAFTNKQQMENYEYGQSCKPSQSVVHGIECLRSATPVDELYVRIGPVTSGQDIRVSDLATFYIATVGMQGTSVNLGELWCSYDIEFYKPNLESTGGTLDYYHLPMTTTNITTTSYWGTSIGTPYTQGNLAGVTISNTVITFPSSITSGNYMMSVNWVGTSAAVVVLPTLSLVNAAALNILNGEVHNSWNTPSSTTTTLLTIFECFTITGPNATFTFSGGTLPTGVDAGDVVIMQLPSSLISTSG